MERSLVPMADDRCGKSPTEKRLARRYVYESLAAAILYCALAFILKYAVEGAGGIGKYALAILPLLGVGAITLVMVRYVRRLDELQRQLTTNAAAVAAIVTVIVCMALGFLESAGLPRFSMTWVFPVAVLSWTAAMCFLFARR